MIMACCLLRYGWKDYDDFSQLVEKFLYTGRGPSFYRNDNYYEYSEEDFTGLPLGVEGLDSKPLTYFQEWHCRGLFRGPSFAGLEDTEDSIYQKLDDLKTHKIYLELTSGGDGRLEKRVFEEMSKKLVKYVKSCGIGADTEGFDVYLLRFYGVIAFYAARYLHRREGVSISIYSSEDHKKLKRAVTCLSGYIRKGLPLPAHTERKDLVGLLRKIEEINAPDKNEMQLYPKNNRHDNPELTATLRDFSMFLTVVGNQRSPTLMKSIFCIFDQNLTDKKVKDHLISFKAYLISKRVNRRKILLRLQLIETPLDYKEGEINDQYDIPSQHSALLNEQLITGLHIAEYEKLV